MAPGAVRPAPGQALQTVETPGRHSIAEVSEFLGVPPAGCAKTLIVKGEATPLVALVLRGDHDLNEIKAAKLDAVAAPLAFASDDEVRAAAGCAPGSLGPVGLDMPVIVDRSAAVLADFVCGANQDGRHLTGVNWERDLPIARVEDLRNVQSGDPSPDGQGRLSVARGIEVGHIFQLGDKYSRAMQAECLDENGKSVTLLMGCYGIGVSRVVAAAIEQNHDGNGIIWPTAIAPFQLALLPMNMARSERVREVAEQLYRDLRQAGLEVLFEDRPIRPGVMFADTDLIGIPHRLVVGDKSLERGEIEYKGRRDQDSHQLPLADAVDFVTRLIRDELDPVNG